MNRIIFCGLFIFTILAFGCVSPKGNGESQRVKDEIVDAGCGQCLMSLREKKGCDLAVRLDGKGYFVDGFTMKQMGDAHANDGMCNTLRQAKVTGEVVNGRFVASKFQLLPVHK